MKKVPDGQVRDVHAQEVQAQNAQAQNAQKKTGTPSPSRGKPQKQDFFFAPIPGGGEPAEEKSLAGVRLLGLPGAADREYSYYIPRGLRQSVRRGCFVHVPFGRGNRQEVGVVTRLGDAGRQKELKALADVREEVLTSLCEEQLALCEFLTERTFCSFGDAVRVLLPPGAITEVEALYTLPAGREMRGVSEEIPGEDAPGGEGKGEGEDEKGENTLPMALFEALRKAKTPKTAKQLAPFLNRTDGAAYLRQLAREKKLDVIYRLRESGGGKYREYAVLGDVQRCESERRSLRGAKQQAAIEYLLEHGTTELTALREQTGAAREQALALEKKGLIRIEKEPLYRDLAGRTVCAPPDRNTLSEEQQAAAKRLLELVSCGSAKAALLYGVTGSGKTRVIKAVIDGVLAAGRQVILLVPEISLTPQTVALFSSFYGDEVAVLHSSLSDGERFDAWRRMKTGQARICVGTRSAVFAPFDNLGMIVIDEEQEHTYKSEQSPRYHARDVARFRCGRNGALMLLSSATPSVESFYKAKTGVYSLVELRNRYGGATLPDSYLCDMRGQIIPPGEIPISPLLMREIERNLGRREQTILFVQRRGYNSFVRCSLCGETVNCPNCSVTMTYHTKGRFSPVGFTAAEREENGYLSCHYCGYRERLSTRCRACGSESLSFVGFGTQMLEGELARRLPGCRVLRMDADTTGSKYAYERMLEDFRERKYDLLLGTQMVTKGHDFPGVTLVGVLCADSSLFLGDYRAGERTFSQLAQVVGRGGRGEKPGRAVIQTYSPDHPVLGYAGRQDYDGFYKNEIGIRRALDFPPFCDIVLLTVSGEEEELVSSAAKRLQEIMDGLLHEDFEGLRLTLYGPFEAPVYRLNGKYRRRLVLKCRNGRRLRAFLRHAAEEFYLFARKKISLTVDTDPVSL